MNSRIHYYDNAKAFFILLVVYGHFVDFCINYIPSPTAKMLFLLIWSCHMPAFIFIAGLMDHPRSGPPKKRILNFILLGVLAQGILTLFKYCFFPDTIESFHLLSNREFPWFLFVLAGYIFICHLLKDFHPIAVLVISIVLSLVAGYDTNVGDYLNLSRMIVFFPFYWIGYCLDPQKVSETITKTSFRIISVIGLLVMFWFFYLNLDYIYELRGLFTGRNSYSDWVLATGGAWMRLYAYLLSIIITTFTLALIPKRKLPLITKIGQNSLAIYYWHYYVPYALQFSGVYILMYFTMPQELILLIFFGISVLLCIILSLPVFSRPLKITGREK